MAQSHFNSGMAEPSQGTRRSAAERLELLAEIGAVLGSSLDIGSTLRQLAHLVVPRFADWCFVEMPTADGRIEAVAVHHPDERLLGLARTIMERYPLDPESPYGTPGVLRSGEPVLMAEISDAFLVAAAQDEEHLRLLRDVGLRSMIQVPLRVVDRTLGVLSLVTADSGRAFGEDDVDFVQEIALRAALAVDNSRLYAQERSARVAAERAADRSRRLHALAAALNEAATLKQVAEACVEHGRAALDADSGSLARLIGDDDEFELVHSTYGPTVTAHWSRFPLQAGMPLSEAILKRKPILIASEAECERRYPKVAADFREADTVAFAAIPVISGSRPLAGMAFSFRTEQHFNDADHTFLMTLGEQAAQALERARLLESEQRARAEAEAANRAKSDFLSAMSHELRTPLNAIGGYVDLLQAGVRGELTEVQLSDLARIKRAQTLLIGLITDILNFARVEAGRIDVRAEAVPVGPIFTDLRNILEPQIEARQLAAEFSNADHLAVLADAERLQQIMINLLTNAVKFTAHGGSVTVSAQAEGDVVAITVADSGRGIAADKLESIFEPFVQLHRSTSSESQQGVGLGLAISRELARAMNGDLAVQSTPGAGSSFTLRLPAAAVPSTAAAAGSPTAPTR